MGRSRPNGFLLAGKSRHGVAPAVALANTDSVTLTAARPIAATQD